MNFEPNQIYHIYNQGNNRQQIFLEEKNYIFFIQKMRKELLPYCEFLSYCLMPNHFHWLIYTKPEGCEEVTSNPRIGRNSEAYLQKLSKKIGITLASYTRAINNQEKRTGSLFRKSTKIQNGWDIDAFITIDQESTFFKFNDGIEYARLCMNYIHQNPVKANMVKRPEDWAYSSASDYAGLRNGTLCNKKLAQRLNLI